MRSLSIGGVGVALAAALASTPVRSDLQADIDAGFFDDILQPNYIPFADNPLVIEAPSRAERRVAGRAYGSGGKAYAMYKGRSKDARKARAKTRKNQK